MNNGHSVASLRELFAHGVTVEEIEKELIPLSKLLDAMKVRKELEQILEPREEDAVPLLPDIATLSDELSKGASPWMDEYIPFAAHWSPWSPTRYHKAIGLWVLSTVAAGRVALYMGKKRTTPLYIGIIGRSSVHAKTEAATIGRDVIRQAELGFLLGSQRTTPQKLLSSMTSKVPCNYETQDDLERAQTRVELAFAGQKGWYSAEYGTILKSTMQATGPMAEFHGIMRELDDGEGVYSNSTVTRGDEKIDTPYLSLLASMTPDDLFAYAQRGSALWNDGYFARFILVCPDPNGALSEDVMPGEERVFPASLIDPIRAWHEQLGARPVEIAREMNYDTQKETGKYKALLGEMPEQRCTLGVGVYDAYSNYVKAMRKLVIGPMKDVVDLQSSYTRLPSKALRIAMLLASFENNGHIELRHWAWAQEFCEELRAYLHEVYALVNDGAPSPEVAGEEKVISAIRKFMVNKKMYPTAREVGQYSNIPTKKALEILTALAHSGVVDELAVGESGRRKGTAYRVCADASLQP